MATESKTNKNAIATCIVQVVRLISLKLLKLATHETLNTDWPIVTCLQPAIHFSSGPTLLMVFDCDIMNLKIRF